MRKHLAVSAVLLTTACASQPQTPPLAPAGVPAVAATPATVTPVTTLQDARKAGYKIVDRNGETVYCREQLMTGSHMRKETICLTEEEFETVRDASRRNLEQMQRRTPPPQGT